MIAAVDDPRIEARERLSEVLKAIIPDFQENKPFTCPNLEHPDRHPSARYMPKAKRVKCYACGWSGDTFDAVKMVYRLGDAEAFKRTYEMLGIATRPGSRSPRTPRPTPAVAPKGETVYVGPTTIWTPEEIQYLLNTIFPPGWIAAPTIPPALAQADEAELGVVGFLTEHPAAIGDIDFLRPEDFSDPILAAIYECLQSGGDPRMMFDNLPSPCPPHQFRRLARAVHDVAAFWRLQAALQRAETAHLNGESPETIFIDLIEDTIDDRPLESWPSGRPADVLNAIMSAYRQRQGVAVKPLAGRVAAR
jgi:hypothetical protein